MNIEENLSIIYDFIKNKGIKKKSKKKKKKK